MKSKFFKKSMGQTFSIEGGTEGIIYPDNPEVNFTVVEVCMSGEYPVNGYSVNERCAETLLMLEGEFQVRVDEDKYVLQHGDMLTITPSSRYRIKGNGRVIDFIAPKWDKNQNKIVEDNNFTV